MAILASFLFVFLCASQAHSQTKIIFAKGASSKTMTVTIPAGGEKSFSLQVRKSQVININVEGDINVSKKTEFPVISINLVNGDDEVDNSQDGEAYLSVFTGRSGNYIFSVANSDKKRARTFTMKVFVSNNREDFLGGESVN